MSWLFSRALVAEYSAANCSDGGPCAPSKSTDTPLAFWSHAKTTDNYPPSLYGMTFGHLTDDRGEELLTSFLAGFRARTSAQQEKESASTELSPGFGPNLPASLAKFDRSTSSWKTPPCLPDEALTAFLGTWPRWGMMRDGECWELSTWAPHIRGTEFGLWQTPVADDAVNRKIGKWNSRGEPKLSAQVLFPTPTVCGNYNRKGASSTSGNGLATVVGGTLNPMWVEWLMGWPIGWTVLKPLGTDRFRQWQRLHGRF